VETRYDERIERLRAAARPGRPAPAVMRRYLDKVGRAAYEVTDDDVAALKTAGLDEDEIFEQTVAAAVAVGLAQREAALGVLG
jgi:alkylhydroperoxidase family enzyme